MLIPGTRPATWTATGFATARLNRAMRRPRRGFFGATNGPDLGWAEWAALIGRSQQGEPSVDRQHLPGDVAGLFGKEEDGRGRHLPRRALAAERYGCPGTRGTAGRGGAAEGRVDQAGAQHVGPDAAAGALHGDVAVQSDEARLGRVVGGDAAARPQSGHRSDEHDRRVVRQGDERPL